MIYSEAQVQQLPDIWEELIEAGFESGHAYGKSLRTVKSCVGTTWCRYGVQDSVGFAIRLEQRYRGIRTPHKVKMAVSGCVRECAEAQGKDVGLVATENGYNLYVCGNGGAKPRHAELLATDLDEETAVRYIDRFMMYYVKTADKLNRTATWIEKMEGGIKHLKEVVIEDRLGICSELEEQLHYLVDTYQCEWKEVVNDPEKRKLFRQFVNTDEDQAGIELIAQRDQQRPTDWPKDFVPISSLTRAASHLKTPVEPATPSRSVSINLRKPASKTEWIKVGTKSDFPKNGGATIKYGDVQIAVYNFTSQDEWYACQKHVSPQKRFRTLARNHR